MMRDLNDLLARHARGEDTDDAFAEFMARHGEFFPENPPTSTSWSTRWPGEAAAAERLMRSLTPQQREELAELMAQALGDGPAGRSAGRS